MLRSGGRLPVKFTRPEIAEILREHYSAERPRHAPAEPSGRSAGQRRLHPLVHRTLRRGQEHARRGPAAAARRRRAVEILDGDEVRTYLSKGLGFSKEDRDTNIRRIGYVARLLARNGVAVITAAISPYREMRDEVRRQAEEDGIPFVEVFASADDRGPGRRGT